MIKTDFFYDSIEYYQKAKFLQNRNLGEPLYQGTDVEDPLMDNVHIYDTVNRRFAGFCKVSEDIMGNRHPAFTPRFESFKDTLDMYDLHFLHLLHRFTGSGASFEPRLLPDGLLNPREHGYCNSIVEEVGKIIVTDGLKAGVSFLSTATRPFVTSKGNQCPSLKNPHPNKYRLATQYYFANFAPLFILDYLEYLQNDGYIKPIKKAVDFCLDWHSERGFKRWKFVLTAFVMDTAEYYPNLVNQNSDVYHGSNCIRTMDLCFIKEKSDKMSRENWYDKCMNQWVEYTKGKPYELEDVPGCDYIRYIKEYVPKGYEHLDPHQVVNASLVKNSSGRFSKENQDLMDKILGK